RIRHKFLRQVTKEDRHALERATRTIIEQVDSLKSMVNDFSEYARSAQMLSRAVDVNDLIRDVVELYKHTRSSAGVVPLHGGAKTGKGKASRAVTTKLNLDTDLPQIPADPGRLRQVLHNLLLNSRDALAATAKPVIRINTRVVGENDHRFVELTVQDNGPGFPEALLAHLYEPYVTHKDRGTGLGLAIVKRIVEEHGGTIRAYNLKEGGACVVMRLPVTTAAAAGPAPAPAAAQATRGENKA
ncbi:MAG: ATP-binding protein, partial [Gammaproteobacteria bacterium]|nr:ATP-binding protein [Gammaproteobacteria bacterium]